MDKRSCLDCQTELEGRRDKLYCDNHCRAAYHQKRKRNGPVTFYQKVEATLKRNRQLLSHFNRAGKATVRAEVLLKAGFDPNFFTHYYKTQKGDVYLFCYEHGFLKRKENGKVKYVLIKWQTYMEKKVKQ